MSSLSSQQILFNNDDLESLESSSVVLSSVDDISSIVSDTTDEQHLVDLNESQSYKNISELPVFNDLINSNDLKKQLEQIAPSNTYNNENVKENVNVKSAYLSENSNLSHNDANTSICTLIPRSCWLALEPFQQYKYLEGSVDNVIICHTGSQSSTSTAVNMELIRNIQTFHIDSQGWDDIGYNFLIGCDGNVYEGRGWGVVGVHTYGYNSRSVGITFIGSFMRTLPTQKALEACKNLLTQGVNEGHLTCNYKLLGHRQCISTISPGRLLFEEISNWDHFYNNNDN